MGAPTMPDKEEDYEAYTCLAEDGGVPGEFRVSANYACFVSETLGFSREAIAFTQVVRVQDEPGLIFGGKIVLWVQKGEFEVEERCAFTVMSHTPCLQLVTEMWQSVQLHEKTKRIEQRRRQEEEAAAQRALEEEKEREYRAKVAAARPPAGLPPTTPRRAQSREVGKDGTEEVAAGKPPAAAATASPAARRLKRRWWALKCVVGLSAVAGGGYVVYTHRETIRSDLKALLQHWRAEGKLAVETVQAVDVAEVRESVERVLRELDTRGWVEAALDNLKRINLESVTVFWDKVTQ